MDRRHPRVPSPTALHTLLPGVSFVGQHISGKEKNDEIKKLSKCPEIKSKFISLMIAVVNWYGRQVAPDVAEESRHLPQQRIFYDVQLAS